MANILSISKGWMETIYRKQFSPATGKTFVAGDLVYESAEGICDYASLADNEDKPVYVVLEGNDTYSGAKSKKVAVIAGHAEFTVSDYQTGSYVVNTPLTASSGKFAVAGAAKKVIAHVLSFSLSQGLKVKFHG